jgi:hypothetical protein
VTRRLRYDDASRERPRTPSRKGLVRIRPLRAVAVGATVVFAATCTDSSGGAGGPVLPAPETPAGSPSTSAAGTMFAGHGVSFTYPKGWKQFELSDSSASTGNVNWEETVGIDGRNIVSVARYTLGVSVTDANIGERTESIGSQIESLFTQAGGALSEGPTHERLAGLPALSFTGSVRTPNGRAMRTRLVLAFDGTTEYAVNCQYDERARAEIEAGCDRVASTLTLTG